MAYHNNTFTGTGAQTAITIAENHKVTIVVNAGASDVYDVEYRLDDAAASTYIKAASTLSGDTDWVSETPVRDVRLNITTNVSAAIQMEVLTAFN